MKQKETKKVNTGGKICCGILEKMIIPGMEMEDGTKAILFIPGDDGNNYRVNYCPSCGAYIRDMQVPPGTKEIKKADTLLHIGPGTKSDNPFKIVPVKHGWHVVVNKDRKKHILLKTDDYKSAVRFSLECYQYALS